MGWKLLVSEERSYSSVQSNFFQVILSLTLLWCYALFSYQSTNVVLTLEDWVNFCTSPHTILHSYSTNSLSHEYFKGTYTGVIKGTGLEQGFRPVLVSAKSRKLWRALNSLKSMRFTSPHTVWWKRMKRNTAICDFKKVTSACRC